MAAQNLPGIAVLKAHNYKAPVSSILSVTGFVNMLAAPFGGYAINLAAITAAICMTEDVDKAPEKRYWAAISGGGILSLNGNFCWIPDESFRITAKCTYLFISRYCFIYHYH